jgi:hypothetical protein
MSVSSQCEVCRAVCAGMARSEIQFRLLEIEILGPLGIWRSHLRCSHIVLKLGSLTSISSMAF